MFRCQLPSRSTENYYRAYKLVDSAKDKLSKSVSAFYLKYQKTVLTEAPVAPLKAAADAEETAEH